jgi:hypothetical protein
MGWQGFLPSQKLIGKFVRSANRQFRKDSEWQVGTRDIGQEIWTRKKLGR